MTHFIDWLTLVLTVPVEYHSILTKIIAGLPQVMKWIPNSGKIEWSISTFQSHNFSDDDDPDFLPSDYYKIAVKFQPDSIIFSGSPARFLNEGNNVFGPHSLNVAVDLFHAAIVRFFQHYPVPIPLPPITDSAWSCRRIDMTSNFLLPSLVDCSTVIDLLANRRAVQGAVAEFDGLSLPDASVSKSWGGKTVYWGRRSKNTKTKVYAKGPHLRHQLARDEARCQGGDEILVDRLLRFEVTFGSKFFYNWRHDHDPGTHFLSVYPALVAFFNSRRDLILGNNFDIRDRKMEELDLLISVCPSLAIANSVYRTLLFSRSHGIELLKQTMSKRSFYRHVALLKKAGLHLEDAPNLIRFVRTIEMQPVGSWEELRKLA